MGSAPLSCKIFPTIHQVPQKEWDSINTEDGIFHSFTFLQDLEDAKVENSKFWYLLIYKNDVIQSTAILSAFIINLDIFIGAGSFIAFVRKLWPNFLKIKILMCGIPASFGQKNIILADSEDSSQILKLVSKIMDDIAKEEKIKYLAFKEFKAREIRDFEGIRGLGYFRAYSLPYTSMDITWKTFTEYLGALRPGYKRQIVNSLQKVDLTADFSLAERDKKGDQKQISLHLSDTRECTPEIFYKLYKEVMSRASSKLETLNLDFFRNYFSSHKEDLALIVLKVEGIVIGSAILIPHQRHLSFTLIGKLSERDAYDTYFNLIIAIIKYGIENNYSRINMGQTSYYPKLRVGATTEDVFIYFKSLNYFMHTALKTLNKVIFPETKIKTLHVFKNR